MAALTGSQSQRQRAPTANPHLVFQTDFFPFLHLLLVVIYFSHSQTHQRCDRGGVAPAVTVTSRGPGGWILGTFYEGGKQRRGTRPMAGHAKRTRKQHGKKSPFQPSLIPHKLNPASIKPTKSLLWRFVPLRGIFFLCFFYFLLRGRAFPPP